VRAIVESILLSAIQRDLFTEEGFMYFEQEVVRLLAERCPRAGKAVRCKRLSPYSGDGREADELNRLSWDLRRLSGGSSYLALQVTHGPEKNLTFTWRRIRCGIGCGGHGV
jgi:hypothetical protein